MTQAFKRRDFLKLAAAAVAPGTLPAGWAADPMARIEGKAVFYTTLPSAQSILKAFHKASGIQGVSRRIPDPGFLTTLLAQATAGELTADVLQAPLPMLNQLKDEGILAPYQSPSTRGYPNWAMRDDTITLFAVDCVSYLYNPHHLQAAQAPNTWQDLVDPQWKGRIVMANPASHAATITWLVALKDQIFHSGDAWHRFLKALAANQPQLVDTFEATLAPIESGEKRIAIASTSLIVTHAPAALAWAPRAGPLLGTALAIAVAAMAPHPAAARAFMDYWLSDRAMGLFAHDTGNYVLAPGVSPAIDGFGQVQARVVRDLSDDERQHWGQEFSQIFGTH